MQVLLPRLLAYTATATARATATAVATGHHNFYAIKTSGHKQAALDWEGVQCKGYYNEKAYEGSAHNGTANSAANKGTSCPPTAELAPQLLQRASHSTRPHRVKLWCVSSTTTKMCSGIPSLLPITASLPFGFGLEQWYVIHTREDCATHCLADNQELSLLYTTWWCICLTTGTNMAYAINRSCTTQAGALLRSLPLM